MGPPENAAAGPWLPRAGAWAFAITLALLLATCDERFFGLIADGRQMLATAGSLAFHGELGISREHVSAFPRPAGDAVSRYGLGTSFVETAAVLSARLLHRAAPGASSAPLFALIPCLLLALAAGGIAEAARHLGAGPRFAVAAGSATVLATPLWAYGGSDFSEPLGAAALALLTCTATRLRSAPPGARRPEALAGGAAGIALLTKSVLLLPALPLLAAAAILPAPPGSPPVPRGRRRPEARPRVRLTVLTVFAAFAALWALLELARFGKPGGGYPGEHFSTPFLTGLSGLTVLPNKGLLVYAPLLALAPWGVAALRRKDRVLALCLAASPLLLIGVTSLWWAWDGQAGWGPRLLLPALPALVLLAATGAGRPGRAGPLLFALLGIVGTTVNLPGVLAPFEALETVAISDPPVGHLALTPSWWPPRLGYAYLVARCGGPDGAARIASGTFAAVEPPLAPDFARTMTPADGGYVWPNLSGNSAFEKAEIAPMVLLPFRWPFLGRSWLDASFAGADPLRLATRDLALRGLDVRRPDRTLLLAGLLLDHGKAAPDPRDVALRAEALRLLGRVDEARAEASRVPDSCHPLLLWPRTLTGAGLECVPAVSREAIRASVEQAARAGKTLPAWLRELRGP